jgi:hypothetical protein
MLKSRRLHHIALGGGLIASLLSAVPALGQVQEPNADKATSQAVEQQGEPLALLPLNITVTIPPQDEKSPRPYQELCDKPQTNEEADICQQWRMANAAQEQIYWLGRQYKLAQWEIVLLTGSIIVTLLAVIAAAIAARSAQQSVAVAQDTARRELRAYVSGRPNFIVSFSNAIPARAHYEISNGGSTPAYNLRNAAGIDVFPYPLPKDFKFPDVEVVKDNSVTLFSASPLQGIISARRVFTDDEISRVLSGECRLYVWGTIIYEDIFKNPQITKFARSVSGTQDVLKKLTSNHITKDLELFFEAVRDLNTAT